MNKLVMATVVFFSMTGGLFTTAFANENVQGSVINELGLFSEYGPGVTSFQILHTIFAEKKEVVLEARKHLIFYTQSGKISPYLKSLIDEIRSSGNSQLENFTDEEIANELAEF